MRNWNTRFVLDGETVLFTADGHSDFNGLHSRRYDEEVEFYAFDMLIRDSDDIRKLPLHLRKAKLARLLARRVDGIHPASFEQGEISPSLFQHARLLRLEGPGLETPRECLSRRPVGQVDQGQEPGPAFSRVMDSF